MARRPQQWYTATMKLSFDGRLVMVTGGTGALGSAVVARLLDAGATVAVTCWGPVSDGFTFREDPRVTVFDDVDLTDEKTATRVFSELDGLWASVHVAGGFDMSPLLDTSLEALERQWKMNAVTSFLACREAARAMIAKPADAAQGGRIVNVGAKPALHPVAGMIAYSMAKAAVVNMTQALAIELAPQGVWVNAVIPSIMDTTANRSAMPDAAHDQWPTTDDVAATITFLVSPQNAVTHSAIVPVYGRS